MRDARRQATLGHLLYNSLTLAAALGTASALALSAAAFAASNQSPNPRNAADTRTNGGVSQTNGGGEQSTGNGGDGQSNANAGQSNNGAGETYGGAGQTAGGQPNGNGQANAKAGETNANAGGEANGVGPSAEDFINAESNPSNWILPAGDYSGNRQVKEKEIGPQDVKQMQVAWTFNIPEGGPIESSPIVWDGTIYITSNQDDVHALDAKTGAMKWQYNQQF